MKILVITYHFPPIGGMSPLRIVHFIKALKEADNEIDVLTISPAKNHPVYKIDEDYINLIPKGVRIFRTYPGLLHILSSLLFKSKPNKRREMKDGKEGYNYLFKIMRKFKPFLKALMIPDTKSDWFPFALSKGYKLIKTKKYDLILSHGYPFTSHLLAYFFKKFSGTKWIGDYGDPWAFNPDSINLPKWRKTLEKIMESHLIKDMDRILVTTDETQRGYLEFYPFLKKEKIHVIECGYEEVKFKMVEPETSEKFRIVYTGIFCENRKPDSFFRALVGFEKENDFEVVIAGNVDPFYLDYVKNLGVDSIVNFRGHIPHKEAVALQKGASLLLIFGWTGGFQIPAKFFEYLAAKRPILAIKYDDKDIVAKHLSKLNRGVVIENRPDEINRTLKELYLSWKKKKLDNMFNLEIVEDFSWNKLTKKLVRIVEDVVER